MRNRRLASPLIFKLSLPAGLAGVLGLSLTLSLALTLSGCQTPGAPDPGNFSKVALKAVDDARCVTVSPDSAEIWSREVAGKPNQVRWTAESATPYRWVIDFKGNADQKDQFGRRVIPCRAPGRAVTSGLPRQVTHSPGGRVEWTYRVTLESCDPGPGEPVCESDPVIIIRDVQH